MGGAGADLWASIFGDLADAWTLDAREIHLLERACKCQDEIVALEAAVALDGETIKGSRGQTIVHPALAAARQLSFIARFNDWFDNGFDFFLRAVYVNR